MNEMSILALAKICGEAGKDHATVNMIRKCLDNDVPNEYLKLLLANSDTEELKAYRNTGLTPEKIREFDEEYQRKCVEVAQLQEKNTVLQKTTKTQELFEKRAFRELRELIDTAKELSELFPNEGHEYIETLVKWMIIGRRNMLFSGRLFAGVSTAMRAACLQNIPDAFQIRYFKGNEGHIDLLDNKDDSVIIVEEIKSALSALQYIQGTGKLSSALATLHAPTVEHLIMAFRNYLLSTNVFPDEKSAEMAAVKAINIDFHTERSQADEKFVERITEIIPTDDPADGKLYTAKNLIEYRDGKYVMVAMPSDKMLDEIRMMLPDSDKEAFEKDMEMLRNAILITEEVEEIVAEDTCTAKETNSEEVAEADNTVAENAEETVVEDNSADVEAAEETVEEDKSKGGQKRKINIDKIMALRNAGWKIKDIADDMHLTPAAVSHAIWRDKKKKAETK